MEEVITSQQNEKVPVSRSETLIDWATFSTSVAGFTGGLLMGAVEYLDRIRGYEAIPDDTAVVVTLGGIAVGLAAYNALSNRVSSRSRSIIDKNQPSIDCNV